ncbi:MULTISPECIES: TetR/AcrR family transcriptional regulator [unclassified Nocardiopsis]|uniref:TetR/AcrR family transcriptional regulator n=1 Tax=Nocardiopsis TaxID=2013 RepID=UPI00387B5A8C
MPKQVDHRQRRAQIAEAVCALIADRGLEAVSLRDVATRAGVSMGRVQHYFHTKDDMLRFALEYVGEHDAAGVHEQLAALADPGPREVARAVLGGLLAASPEGEARQRVGVAFQARALVEPGLARFLLQGYAGIQGVLEDLLRAHGRTGAARDAAVLMALAEGLRLQSLLGHLTPERARGILDGEIDRVLPGGDAGQDAASSPRR